MSEDQRVSRNAQEPEKTGPAGAERWAAYLDWLREDLIEGILALPPQEQRRSRLPSDWSPIELLNHLVHMEQRWFIWGFLGEAVAEPWGDWTVPEPWSGNDADAGPDARWAVGDHKLRLLHEVKCILEDLIRGTHLYCRNLYIHSM